MGKVVERLLFFMQKLPAHHKTTQIYSKYIQNIYKYDKITIII